MLSWDVGGLNTAKIFKNFQSEENKLVHLVELAETNPFCQFNLWRLLQVKRQKFGKNF